MKCLSVKQPFATWLVEGIKNREIRKGNTNHRGMLLIHSSKAPDVEFFRQFGINPEKFKNGVILGVVKLDNVIRKDMEYYSWIIETIRVFKDTIPYDGQLGIFEVNNEVIEKEINVKRLEVQGEV